MEETSSSTATASAAAPVRRNRPSSSLLVVLLVSTNTCLVLVGAVGALLLRVYMVHGGKRMFLSSLLQMCGWPLLLPPICVSLFRSRRSHGHGSASALASLLLPPRLAAAGAVLGVVYAIPSFVYALGSQALPLSTSSLLSATQLAFTAVAAFIFTGLRFTPFSANAVVLLTISPAVLAVGSGKPAAAAAAASTAATTTYWLGFCETIASTALTGLVLPLVELAMARYGHRTGPSPSSSYATVMQMQAVMGAAGTAVCLIGMAINGDFQAVPSEAATFELGSSRYYLLLVWTAVAWQLSNLGATGLICCASSLVAGIAIAALVPLSEILAVVFLHEEFDGAKGIALLLSLWGFASYLYGETKQVEEEEAHKNKDDYEYEQQRSRTGDDDLQLQGLEARLLCIADP